MVTVNITECKEIRGLLHIKATVDGVPMETILKANAYKTKQLIAQSLAKNLATPRADLVGQVTI